MTQKMLWLSGVLFVTLFALMEYESSAMAASADPAVATHKQARVIRPALDKSEVRLNTFAMSPDGALWLCCTSSGDGSGCLLIYSVEGKLKNSVSIDFVPTAINFSNTGIPFVAGSGKVARLTVDGSVDLVVDAPNLLSEDAMKEKLQRQSEKMIADMLESSESQIKRIDGQIATIKADTEEGSDEAANERRQKRNNSRLKVLEQQRELLQEMQDAQRTSYEQMFAEGADVSRMKRSTGIAVAKQDLFVCLPSSDGQGYAIYRMTHDLTEPKSIIDNVRGCCGQLDIQTDGEHVVIAENSTFKVRYVDREGTDVKSFGERGQTRLSGQGSIAGWGSCCNPMNVRCLAGDEVLVAESSIGHIKRYSSNGDFLGLVGTAKIAGGCKHVAIARDKDRDWYFMMNTAGNNIAVLVPLADAPGETEDERDARLAMEGLGQKLIGSWKCEEPKAKVEPATTSSDEDIAGSFDFGQYIAKQNCFLKLDADGKVSRQQEVVFANAVTTTNESDSGLFGAIATLFTGRRSTGKSSVTPAVALPEETTRWVAVKQDGDVVHLALEESQVRNYVAAVRFIDDGHAEFKWYYNEVAGMPLATVSYVRVGSAGAMAPACDKATCNKENCDHTHCEKTEGASNAIVNETAGDVAPLSEPK